MLIHLVDLSKAICGSNHSVQQAKKLFPPPPQKKKNDNNDDVFVHISNIVVRFFDFFNII